MSTLTVYGQGDGRVSTDWNSTQCTFSNIRDHSGTTITGSYTGFVGAGVAPAGINYGGASGWWGNLHRSAFQFDTSALTASATISAATLSLYGGIKLDDLACSPTFDIYTSSPASTTSITGNDFDTLGSTSQTGAAKTYSSISTSAYNDWTLDSTGRGNISKTGVSKFGCRMANVDVGNSSPTWSNAAGEPNQSYWFAESSSYAGTTRDPKLVITYTMPVAPTVTTQAASSVLAISMTGNGNITADGGATVTRRGFCYMTGTSGDPTTANSAAYDDGSFGTGAYTKAITGLAPNTSYRVRAYATNSGGTSYGSTVQEQTTAGLAGNFLFVG